MAVVWQGCSVGHGSNHGADRDKGRGVVAGMQITSCFVASARVKCTKKRIVSKISLIFRTNSKQEDKHELIADSNGPVTQRVTVRANT